MKNGRRFNMQNTQKEPDQPRMVPVTQTQRDWHAHKAWALCDEARCLRQRFDQDLAGVLEREAEFHDALVAAFDAAVPVAPHPERPSLSLREVIEEREDCTVWAAGARHYTDDGRGNQYLTLVGQDIAQPWMRESAAEERTDA